MKKLASAVLLGVLALFLMGIPYSGPRWPSEGGAGGDIGTQDVMWVPFFIRDDNGFLAPGDCAWAATFTNLANLLPCLPSGGVGVSLFWPLPNTEITIGTVVCQTNESAENSGHDIGDSITLQFAELENDGSNTNFGATFTLSDAMFDADGFEWGEWSINATRTFTGGSLQLEVTAETDANNDHTYSFRCFSEVKL